MARARRQYRCEMSEICGVPKIVEAPAGYFEAKGRNDQRRSSEPSTQADGVHAVQPDEQVGGFALAILLQPSNCLVDLSVIVVSLASHMIRHHGTRDLLHAETLGT